MRLIVAALLALSPVGSTATPDLESEVIGYSVQGRPIEAIRVGPPGEVRVLVVGVIHGRERAGLKIVDELRRLAPPRGVEVWLVPDMNPDGTAARTRGNANGVDLNRNFPHRWRRLAVPGHWQYSGTARGSEPETKAMVAFVERLRPTLSIWYHQDLNLISPGSGGVDTQLRTHYADLTSMRLARIRTGGTFTGVATNWHTATVADSYAFVVELGKRLDRRGARTHAAAVHDTASLLLGP